MNRRINRAAAAAAALAVSDITLLANWYRSDRSVYDEAAGAAATDAAARLSDVLVRMCS